MKNPRLRRSHLFALGLGLLAGLLAPAFAGTSARWMTADDSLASVGGSCPNIGCVDQTCEKDRNCKTDKGFCTPYNFGNVHKCVRAAFNNFAKCGGADSKAGYSCSETGLAGCVTLYLGEQTAEGDCPEANCSVGGSTCGTASFTCVDTSCPT